MPRLPAHAYHQALSPLSSQRIQLPAWVVVLVFVSLVPLAPLLCAACGHAAPPIPRRAGMRAQPVAATPLSQHVACRANQWASLLLPPHCCSKKLSSQLLLPLPPNIADCRGCGLRGRPPGGRGRCRQGPDVSAPAVLSLVHCVQRLAGCAFSWQLVRRATQQPIQKRALPKYMAMHRLRSAGWHPSDPHLPQSACMLGSRTLHLSGLL